MKRVLLGLAVAVVVLAAVLLGRTLAFTSVQVQVAPAPAFAVDAGAVAEHLAQAVRVKTISDPAVADPQTFAALRQLLRALYPRTFAALEVEELGKDGQALLLTWKGRDAALAPVLLLAHQDVVPVEPGTEQAWTHPPWEGAIAAGYVWGRGAMDDKAALISILESVEALLAAGHAPRRTVLLGFGFDEEVGGSGAAAIAARLEERGQRLLFVLDEGLVRVRGVVPGVNADVALLGVAEKGFLTVELKAATQGGHSQLPPTTSAIGRVARAVHQLETTATEASLDGPTGMFLDAVGPEMSFGLRVVMANRWLLSPVVLRIYEAKPSTRAVVRTTVAPTMLRAGVKDNVLAREAKAVVNFRIRPGETREGVLAWAKRTIADPEVTLTESTASISSAPSPVTRVDSPGFRRVERTLRSIFPETLVAPTLTVGATDARHFSKLSDSVLRFAPMLLEAIDLDRLHGVDERIGVENLGEMARFYRQVLIDADAP